MARRCSCRRWMPSCRCSSNLTKANKARGMKRILPYAALGVLQVFFLTAAFLVGYLSYARIDSGESAVIPNLGGDTYPILSQVRSLLASHFIGSMPDDK